MLNIEKYKDQIIEKTNEGLTIDCTIAQLSGFVKDNYNCNVKCRECIKHSIKWMYEDNILDEVEREYLAHFINPFRNDIASITKQCSTDKTREYLSILYKGECDDIPTNMRYFNAGTMYKGMELGRKYTIEELGL